MINLHDPDALYLAFTYDAFSCKLNQVLRGRVARVVIEDITQYWVFPIDIDGREIDTPNNNILPICRNSRAETDIQGLNLAVECIARDIIDDPWYERALVIAVGWFRRSCACRIRCRRARVAEDTSAIVIVGTVTSSFDFSAEPIISNSLVGSNDYIITLT